MAPERPEDGSGLPSPPPPSAASEGAGAALPATAGGGSATGALTAHRARELRFVRRVHRLRTLGLGLGSLCVGSVLRLHDISPAWWALLLVNGFAWPHVAWMLAARSANPQRAEFRNLMFDSAIGGMWITVMQFNLLPSVLLAAMLLVDKISVRGPALLLRSLALIAAGCLGAWAILRPSIDIVTPMSVIFACLPFLVLYPLALGLVNYSLARKLARQNQRLDALGRTDGLTRVANRRQGFTQAEKELARFHRTGRPAVLLILDVDRFKAINDRYGHPTGDEVLVAVAETLRECCRGVDVVARYGGDEFMVILPETELRGAETAAARIRRRLDARPFANAPGLRCTVSVGAAEADVETAHVDTWVERADAALYRAKAAGRDRFAAAPAQATPAR